MDFNMLTSSQKAALFNLKLWYNIDIKEKQYFKLEGYAGTGKTWLINKAIEDLGINKRNVAFCAYTGAAVINMIRKGNPFAKTIHRLIYRTVREEFRDDIPLKDKEGNIVFDENGNPKLSKTVIKFYYVTELRPKAELANIELIVVDEYSMIDDSIIKDILSFGIKVIFIGDPKQLKPVEGKNKLVKNSIIGVSPDVMLTDIMRQDNDSPIIDLSFKARNFEPIMYGDYYDSNDDLVSVVLNEDEYKNKMRTIFEWASIVIVGKNTDRIDINNYFRENSIFVDTEEYADAVRSEKYNFNCIHNNIKYKVHLPVVGEKIVCTRNNWKLFSQDGNYNLVNGDIFIIDDIIDIDYENKAFIANIHAFCNEDCVFKNILIGYANFAQPIAAKDKKNEFQYSTDRYYEKELITPFNGDHQELFDNEFIKRSEFNSLLNDFDFGYAITCHKSQGSQFSKVAAIVPFMGGGRSGNINWLYTAITRATDQLVLVIPKSYYYVLNKMDS